MQRCVAAHVFPHDPQFIGSAPVSKQVAPQSAMPVGHTHAPATQLCIAPHAVPHDPQFDTSDVGSVQTGPPAPVQICLGALHESAHVPLSQN